MNRVPHCNPAEQPLFLYSCFHQSGHLKNGHFLKLSGICPLYSTTPVIKSFTLLGLCCSTLPFVDFVLSVIYFVELLLWCSFWQMLVQDAVNTRDNCVFLAFTVRVLGGGISTSAGIMLPSALLIIFLSTSRHKTPWPPWSCKYQRASHTDCWVSSR